MTKSGKGNKTFSVIVSEKTYEELKKWAKDRDWSISQAVRNLIEQGMTET
jgi:predicted CopG family antitoxin